MNKIPQAIYISNVQKKNPVRRKIKHDFCNWMRISQNQVYMQNKYNNYWEQEQNNMKLTLCGAYIFLNKTYRNTFIMDSKPEK